MTKHLQFYCFILTLTCSVQLYSQGETIPLDSYEAIFNDAVTLRDGYSYNEALDEFYKVIDGLEFASNKDELTLRARAFDGVIDIFTDADLQLYEDALFYNQKSIEIAEQINDNELLATYYNRKGNIYFLYFEEGTQDKSLPQFARKGYLKSYEIQKETKPDANFSFLFSNISNSYLIETNLSAAEDWANKAKQEATQFNSIEGLLYANLLLTRIYLDQKRFQDALDLGTESLSITAANPTYEAYNYSFYHNLYEGYKALGKSEISLDYLEKKIEIEEGPDFSEKNFADIIVSKENNKIKEKAKNLETKANQIEKKAKRFQRTNIVLILLLGTLGLLGYNVFKSQSLKRKNLELELNQKEQQAELNIVNAMVDGKETERKEIGRFLHDHVSALVNAANIQLEVMASETDLQNNEKLKTTQTILDDIADKVRNLSHQLLSNVLQKYGLAIAFEELCERFTSNKIKFTLHSNLPEGKRYNEAIENKLYGIAQELCNNVLKHSNGNEAFIELEETDLDLRMTVGDNGQGFAKSDIKTGGVGLHQIKTRINSIGGQLEIFSNGKTRIIISIPKDIALKHSHS